MFTVAIAEKRRYKNVARPTVNCEVGCTMEYFRVVLNLQTSVIGCLPFIKLRRKNESFRHLRPWFSAIRTFIDVLGVGRAPPRTSANRQHIQNNKGNWNFHRLASHRADCMRRDLFITWCSAAWTGPHGPSARLRFTHLCDEMLRMA